MYSRFRQNLMAVSRSQPNIQHIAALPLGVCAGFYLHDAAAPTHMGKRLNDIRVLLDRSAVLNAVERRVVPIPVRQFVEDDIRVLIQ